MEKGEMISKNLEFFMLIGKLKHVERAGWVERGVPHCERVAGHMYRMAVMAFLFDHDHHTPSIDRDRCIRMALVHDMAECIVGDLTPSCGVTKEEKHRREVAAMERLCSLVGEKKGREMMELFMEYEKQETSEARAVKELDKFDMILQAFEYEEELKRPDWLRGFFDSTEGAFEETGVPVSDWVRELKRRRGGDPDS